MKIINKLSKYSNYFSTFRHCIKVVDKHIPGKDTQGVGTLVLMDKTISETHKRSGGMYFLERDNMPARIELYLEQLINSIPEFVPKLGIFVNYSIVRMLLHEIGHHVNQKYAYEKDEAGWEESAGEYALKYLWKIYGFWMYVFLTLGSLDMRNLKNRERYYNSTSQHKGAV